MQDVDDQGATARYMHVQPRTLEDWRYRGQGPAYIKLGRRVRYRKTDVDAFLAQQTVTPNEAA